MRRKTIIATTALMTLAPIQYAAAQAPAAQVIKLSCEGTSNNLLGMKAPWKQGMTINLTDGTISEESGVVARITKVDGPTIEFSGTGPVLDIPGAPPDTMSVRGSLDRVTGAVLEHVTTTFTDNQTTSSTYALTCKAAKPPLL